MNRWLYILFFAGLLLIACESDRAFNESFPPQKLVLFAFVEPDSTVQVQLGKTFHSEWENSALEEVSGEVFINGRQEGVLVMEGHNRYYAEVRPKPGDRVKIVARAKGLPEAVGETTLPMAGIPLAVDTTLVGPKNKLNRVFYTIHIDDKASERHYYRLLIRTETYTQIGDRITGLYDQYTYDTENDPLLGGRNEAWLNEDDPNAFKIFTNERFEGKGYTMRVSAAAWNTYEMKYDAVVQWEVVNQHVKLIRIDEDSYLYFKSLMLSDRGEGIIEPVQVHSNVQGGVGIVGYAYATTVSFRMPVAVFDTDGSIYY